MKLPVAPFAVACAMLVAAAAPAQTPPESGPGRQGFAERRMQMLLKDITLSPEQQVKVDSIRARYRSKLPAFTPGSRPDSAARQKMRDTLRGEDDEIRAVLTPDQQQLWDRNLAAMRARRRGGP